MLILPLDLDDGFPRDKLPDREFQFVKMSIRPTHASIFCRVIIYIIDFTCIKGVNVFVTSSGISLADLDIGRGRDIWVPRRMLQLLFTIINQSGIRLRLVAVPLSLQTSSSFSNLWGC